MKFLPWLLLVLVAVWGGCQARAAASARAKAADYALAASNETARHDTTRILAAEVATVLGDSLQAVQRRAVQAEQQADALDDALRLERLATADLVAQVRALKLDIADAPVREDTATGARIGSWKFRDAPYTVEATATLPRPPALGTLRAHIRLDPLALNLRLGCGPADAGGIRPASATLTGPTWATLSLGSVEQSAELCRSPALAKKGPSRLKWAGIGAGLVFGLMQVLGGRE